MSASIKVRVEVEVSSAASWGDDCTVAQVEDQGRREAVAAVQRALGEARIRVIGVTVSEITIRRPHGDAR